MSYKDKLEQKKEKFYNFRVSEDKFSNLKAMAKNKQFKIFRNGIIWGIFFEALIVATPICTPLVLRR